MVSFCNFLPCFFKLGSVYTDELYTGEPSTLEKFKVEISSILEPWGRLREQKITQIDVETN